MVVGTNGRFEVTSKRNGSGAASAHARETNSAPIRIARRSMHVSSSVFFDTMLDGDLTQSETRDWVELGRLTALDPFVYGINGPALSTDQFVVRTALVILAACGAVGLRTYAWFHRGRKQ